MFLRRASPLSWPGTQPAQPLGLKARPADQGIRHVQEPHWWQSTRLRGLAGEVEVELTPVQRCSGRGCLTACANAVAA